MTASNEEESVARERADAVRSRPGFIERGIAAAYRARSLESRAGSLLSLTVVCVLGTGLLAWYYSAALKRPAHAAEEARGLAASRAQAEMPLPPLLPIASAARPQPVSSSMRTGAPQPASAAPQLSPSPAPNEASSAGPAAAVPPWLAPWLSSAPQSLTAARVPSPSGGKNPRSRALERRLAGPAFTTRSGSTVAEEGGAATTLAAPAAELPPAVEAPRTTGSPAEPEAAGAAGELAKLLVPALAPAVAAQVLPTRTLLLPKGAFIDCTLETAIDSTLPGMTTCITATDTFGADGKVVLLERGSKLVGETRGEVAQGSSRVFVLWTEARTPTGVVVPLASPGTDELGRSGLPGTVNRHFFQRFGAALLISIIDAGSQAASASRSGTVIYSPTASQDVMSEVLKDTLRIAPTVVKNQGDRIQVLVARDLDFRSVYELRATNHAR